MNPAGTAMCVCACAALTLATPAVAQTRTVPRALFGSNGSDQTGRNNLNVLFDINESWATGSRTDSVESIEAGDFRPDGFASRMTATADYRRERRQQALAATLVTSYLYFPDLGRVKPVGHSGAIGVGLRLPRRSVLQFTSGGAYAPAYLYELFPRIQAETPVEAIAADPDYRIHTVPSYAYELKASFVMGKPRATQFTASTEYRANDFPIGIVARTNSTTAAADVDFSRRWSRKGAWSIGYEYRTGTFDRGNVTNIQRATIGADYALALTRTRLATFRFTASPAFLDVPSSTALAAVPSASPEGGETSDLKTRTDLYQLQMDASVDYAFAANWTANAGYRRGVDFLPLLAAPLLVDGARLEVLGLIGRRVDVSASAAWAAGRTAFDPVGQDLKTETGRVRVRFALARSLAVYSEYHAYYYDLGAQARLAPDLPGVFTQHEIRVGCMIAVSPIASKTKGKPR